MVKRVLTLLLPLFILAEALAQSGNVGVGNAAPVAKLDVAGDLALREGTAIAVAGANPAVVVTLNAVNAEYSFYRITGSPTGTMTLGSIANGVDGQIITLVNATSIKLNLNDNNSAGGIRTPDGSAQFIGANGSVTLQFSAVSQRWYVTNGSGTASTDWTKATTTNQPAAKADNQYVTGNIGIGDFSTVDPAADFHVFNGGGARLTATNAGTALAAFDGGSGTVNARVIIGSNFTGTGTRPESQLEFWNNAFGGGQANSATLSTLSSQGSAAGQVNGNLLFSTSNNAMAPTERMRIESDGDVGIGTTAPYAKLDVLGSIFTTLHGNSSQHHASEQGTTYIGMKSGNTGDGFTGMKMQVGAFGSGGINNGSRIFFQTWGNSISTSRDVMVINEFGNVGIGTAAPNANLEVYKQDGKIRISDTRPDGGTALAELGLEFTHHNLAVTKTAIIAKGIYSWKRADLHFVLDDGADDNSYVTGTDTKMIIKNNGNVGIGTITPNAPLQFPNTIANRKIVMWEVANNDHQYYGFGINGGTLRYQVDATTAQHAFFCGTGTTASKQLVAFKGDGNILLGDPNATAVHDTWILPARPISGANATYLRLGASGNPLQDIYSNFYYCTGNVHIGSTNPAINPLEVQGAMSSNTGNNQNNYIVYVRNTLSGGGAIMTDVQTNSNSSRYLQCRVNGTEVGCLYGNGSNVLSLYSASDQRLKTNITNTSLGLGTLMDIKVREYNWKADGKTVRAGFIAQELYQVYPEAVSKGSDGELTNSAGGTWMVDYAGLTPLLVKAIQDQETEIQKLKEENSVLKNQVEGADNKYISLKEEVEQLKGMITGYSEK